MLYGKYSTVFTHDPPMQNSYIYIYILPKALPQVCMENTARVSMLRDKYSTRQSRVLYLSQDTSLSAIFFVYMSKGSALGGILYFA